MIDQPVIESRTKAIVAEALDVPLAKVHNHSALIDDLGAESIDFLDIVFRLERAFGIHIDEQDVWKGSIGRDSTDIEAGVRRLKERMPEFRWDRFPDRITRDDLPRLITVQTILDYLDTRRAELTDGLSESPS
jgi:acyl carrier protein